MHTENESNPSSCALSNPFRRKFVDFFGSTTGFPNLVKPSYFDDFCESHPERVGVYITSPIVLPLHTNQLHDDTHWLTEAIRDILRCLRDVLPQGYPFADPRYSLFSQNRRSLAKSNCRTTRYPTVMLCGYHFFQI